MRPWLRWVGPALYMAMILGFSSIPGTSPDGSEAAAFEWAGPIISNSLHLPLYAGLGILWALALQRSGVSVRTAALVAVLVAAAFGALDELYQGLVPGRTTSVRDWLADAVGAAAGCAVFLRLRRRNSPTGTRTP